MRPAPEVHDSLAHLLCYPGGDAWEHQLAAVEVVRAACPEARPGLDTFVTAVGALTGGEREELYTRTFDSTDDRSLEVGWQLFGENYARGALLVRLRQLLREYGVPEQTELPDHMSHVLPLLGRAPRALAQHLAAHQVTQAVEKMLSGVRAIESPYVGVLEATRLVLAMHSSPKEEETSQEASVR